MMKNIMRGLKMLNGMEKIYFCLQWFVTVVWQSMLTPHKTFTTKTRLSTTTMNNFPFSLYVPITKWNFHEQSSFPINICGATSQLTKTLLLSSPMWTNFEWAGSARLPRSLAIITVLSYCPPDALSLSIPSVLISSEV